MKVEINSIIEIFWNTIFRIKIAKYRATAEYQTRCFVIKLYVKNYIKYRIIKSELVLSLIFHILLLKLKIRKYTRTRPHQELIIERSIYSESRYIIYYPFGYEYKYTNPGCRSRVKIRVSNHTPSIRDNSDIFVII